MTDKTEGRTPRRAEDVLREESPFRGSLSALDVLGEEFLIVAFKTLQTKWGTAIEISGEIGGEAVKVLTWSGVLLEQAKLLHSHLPVVARIRQEGSYFTMAGKAEGPVERGEEMSTEDELEVPF